MKIYNKLLAAAWMACCTNVHADNKINWGEVSHFFNFDTVAESDKRTNLENNIQLLVNEQLKLPSGQNLWKAFRFWEEQHPELGFQFHFELSSDSGAGIVLQELQTSSTGKQIFCFEITINKIFAKDFSTDLFGGFGECFSINSNNLQKFLNKNMLYRPCLIKLVDPDDPKKWDYHLREQKLPFFITLAHEFLHALNQLERIDHYWNFELLDEYNKTGNLLDILDRQITMQSFLANKLKLKNGIGILKNKYLCFWENKNNDDSLDEMTVILCSKRRIGEFEFAFIGETTFLREHYENKSIISWSHCSAFDFKFWENMHVLLENRYVNWILKIFGLKKTSLLRICANYDLENIDCKYLQIVYSNRKTKKEEIQEVFSSHIENLKHKLIVLRTPNDNYEIYIQWNYSKINTLPKYITNEDKNLTNEKLTVLIQTLKE